MSSPKTAAACIPIVIKTYVSLSSPAFATTVLRAFTYSLS
jgi:hypothetical protein